MAARKPEDRPYPPVIDARIEAEIAPASLPRPNWEYWQCTSTAKVPGIAVPTDVSYFSASTPDAAVPGAPEPGYAWPTTCGGHEASARPRGRLLSGAPGSLVGSTVYIERVRSAACPL